MSPSATERKKIMILGGGPNRIGQGIEFDYCCVHCAIDHPAALRRSARVLPRQHGQEPHAARRRAESRHRAVHLLVDRCGLRESSDESGPGNGAACSDSAYGTSKLMTEIMLRDVAAATNLKYVALRYFNVAGADPRADTGSRPRRRRCSSRSRPRPRSASAPSSRSSATTIRPWTGPACATTSTSPI